MKKTRKLQTFIPMFALLFWPQVVLAQMSARQNTAFEGANLGGSSFTGSESTHLFAGLACVIALIWLAWVARSSYDQWCTGQIKDEAAGGNVLRALFVVIITLVIVTY